MLDELRKKVRKLLTKSKTEDALKVLADAIHQDSLYSDAVLVRHSQFTLATKQFIAGVIKSSEWEEQQHEINHSLLLLLGQLDASDLHWQSSDETGLARAVADLPLRDLGVLDLVNCDRHRAFSRAVEFLRVNRDSSSQFFFLLGHAEQRPSSFAERLAYEIAQSLQAEKDQIVDYEQVRHRIGEYPLDRLCFQPLPRGLFVSASKQMFKRYLGQRLQKYGLETSLDTLLARDVQQEWPFAVLTFAFTIDITYWDNEILTYLEWLVQTFGPQQAGKGPAFYFFFVLDFPEKTSIEQHRITRALQKLVREEVPSGGLLLTDHPPVSADDIAHWLRKVSNAANPTQIQEVLNQFCEVLKQQDHWDERADIAMMHVEALQEIVFQRQLKAQFPHVILPV
ncbi:MAG: hypothetical protein AAFN81_12010 [Bacteroidota bacterium]